MPYSLFISRKKNSSFKKICAGLLALSINFGATVGILFAFPEITFANTTLFNDSFESGNFSLWTSADPSWSVTSGTGHNGSKKAQISNQDELDDNLQKNISTLGYSNLVLSYYYRAGQPLEAGDHVYVEFWDGIVWQQLADHNNIQNGGWSDIVSHNLPSSASNLSSFKFRFRGVGIDKNTGNSDKDEFQLDDVSLVAITELESTEPKCTDNIDNDEDNLIDVNDPDCVPFYKLLTVTTSTGGNIQSSPQGISCQSDCTELYANNTLVTLNPTPISGYTFTGWSGACTGNGQCIVTMNAEKNVHATFEQGTFTLSVSKEGNGAGSVLAVPGGIDCGSDCTESYPVNSLITLNATPENGSTFTGWSGACGGTTTCEVTMNEVRSVVANFTLNTHELTVSVSLGGDVSSNPTGISCESDCTESFNHGSDVLLTATAQSGYLFSNWSGDCTGTNTTCNVSMDSIKSVQAVFAVNSCPDGYQLVNENCEPIPPPPSTACNDTIDNDNDGQADYPADLGCENLLDNDESNTTVETYACSDGIDNDNDGSIDFPLDTDCENSEDTSESGTTQETPLCSDGIDNDNDGTIDYPLDLGCESTNDTDETNLPNSCELQTSEIEIVSDTTNIVEGTNNNFAVPTFIHSAWTSLVGATWIWESTYVAEPDQNETKTFSREFILEGSITEATLSLAADNNFKIWINGSEIASDANQLNFGSVKTYNINTSLFSQGTNVITMEVTNIGTNTTDPEANPAGALYKLALKKNSCVPPPPTCTENQILLNNICTEIPVTPPGGGGSSNFDYWGCTDTTAVNFNPLANKDDGSCTKNTTGGDTGAGTTPSGEVLGASISTEEEPPLPAGCNAYLNDYLRKGKTNNLEQVKLLQEFLNGEMSANLPVTGYFGPLTHSWVKRFQVKYAEEIIKPWKDAGYKGKDIENGTGYVYKTTKRHINLMKCSSLDIPMPDLTKEL